jgi:hypothetical protein
MPHEIVWEHKGVLKRLSGQVPAAEFQRSVELIQADPRFDDIRYVINDFTAVSGHGLDEQHLLELAAIQYGARASNPQVRVIYVGCDSELTRLLRSVLIDSQRSVYQVALFPTLPQARDWLQGELAKAWRWRAGSRAA